MAGMGMRPDTMETMPMGGMPPMSMGGMPPMSMGGMGMRQGDFGIDSEMNAMMTRRLQELRFQETQINSDIAMFGGEASPAAQSLLARRTALQTQIRQLEQQLGVSGAVATAVPGAMPDPMNPMAGMNPAMMQQGMAQPGMVPPGMVPPGMTPDDRMMQGMARPGMPGIPGYEMHDPAMMRANPMLGTDPNRMFFEQQKQEITLELQRVQHQLSFVDANHPMRPILLAEQERLVAQRESVDKQFGQTLTPGGAMPGAAGSTATSLTDLATPTVPPARSNPVISPEIAQMMDAERRLRASGQITSADELKAMIEQQQTGGFVEPQLPTGMPMLPYAVPPNIPMAMSATLPQQAELAELRSTVDSLRNEIASMREEIRALNAMLRRWDQTTEPNSMVDILSEMPEMPVYPEIPLAE